MQGIELTPQLMDLQAKIQNFNYAVDRSADSFQQIIDRPEYAVRIAEDALALIRRVLP